MSPRTARLWVASGSVAAGGLVTESFGLTAAAAAACAPGVLVTTRRWRMVALLALAGSLAGASVVHLRMSALDRPALVALHRERAHMTVEVLQDPEVRSGRASMLVAVIAAAGAGGEPQRVRGVRALLTLDPTPDRLPRATDRIGIEASLRAESSTRARRRGIGVRAYAESYLPAGRSRSPVALAAEAVRGAVRSAAAHVPGAGRGMLEGFLIGDTTRLDPVLEERFLVTGLSHLTAVSGSNVALVLALVGALLTAARAGSRVRIAVLAATTLVFAAASRFEPSVVRAGVMAAVALGARASGARAQPSHNLAVAVLLVLLVDPLASASLGFQLSVLATLGLLTISPRIERRLGPGLLTGALAMTLGATLAVTPLIAIVAGRFSLAAVPANLLVAPLAAPSTVIGALAAAGALILEPLGAIAMVAAAPLWVMRTLAAGFAALPGAEVLVPGWLGVSLAATTGTLALRAGRRPVRGPACVTALLLFIALLAAGPSPRGLVVTMLDVGQGEAIVVRAGERTMLIDGGPDGRLLRRRLEQARISRIDVLVMSHPHADHIDGLAGIAGRIPIGRALDPLVEQDEPALASHGEILGALGSDGVPVVRAVAGSSFALGPALVEILWPPATHLEGTDSDVNNNSIVLAVTYGADRVLFAGETQEEAQHALMARPEALGARVLKVSHHGSKRMVPGFYRATGAALALIPVGQNRYGHPAGETLAALTGMRVLRSDLHGTVTVSLDGRGGAAVGTTR